MTDNLLVPRNSIGMWKCAQDFKSIEIGPDTTFKQALEDADFVVEKCMAKNGECVSNCRAFQIRQMLNAYAARERVA